MASRRMRPSVFVEDCPVALLVLRSRTPPSTPAIPPTTPPDCVPAAELEYTSVMACNAGVTCSMALRKLMSWDSISSGENVCPWLLVKVLVPKLPSRNWLVLPNPPLPGPVLPGRGGVGGTVGDVGVCATTRIELTLKVRMRICVFINQRIGVTSGYLHPLEQERSRPAGVQWGLRSSLRGACALAVNQRSLAFTHSVHPVQNATGSRRLHLVNCLEILDGKVNAPTIRVGASAHRTVSDAAFPATGSGREKLGFAIRQSMLESESPQWRSVEFFIREPFVDVSARTSSAESVFDPEGRDGMIHCGMALQHLKLTLKRHGCFGRVDLFPDLDQPNLAARVHLGNSGTRSDFEQELSKAMEREEGVRRLQTPVSAAVVDWLSCMVARERSWLEFARCEGSQQRLKELVVAPARIRATEIQIQNAAVTRTTNSRWKLPRLGVGRWPERLGRWRKRPVSIKAQATTTAAPEFAPTQFFAPEGAYAVLKTKTDDKHGWLAAGQTLGALLLQARTLGVPCVPFLNPLRHPDLRAELRNSVGHKGFMQVIVCFKAAQPDFLAGAMEFLGTITPRRSSA